MADDYYYKIAGGASEDFDANNGLKKIKQLSRVSKKILDVGCGEGTRLALLDGVDKHGVDVNTYATKLASKKHPKLTIKTYDGNILPYPSDTFDLVYSAYVLEHTQDPYRLIDEMVRVTKKGGSLCFITPNFGSPNRRSPNSVESKMIKLMKGFIADIFFPNDQKLTTVSPKTEYKEIDDDTTVEPYLRKLIAHCKKRGLIYQQSSSLWEIDEGKGIYWKTLKLLGQIKLYPFYFWGPQAFAWFLK